MAINWDLINRGCPNCGSPAAGPEHNHTGRLHWHTLSVWCLRCGWAGNWSNLDKNGRSLNNGT
jgi:hypothetical protein